MGEIRKDKNSKLVENILLECELNYQNCRLWSKQLSIYCTRLAWLQRITTISSFSFAAIAGSAAFFLNIFDELSPFVIGFSALFAALLPAIHAGMKCEEHLAKARVLEGLYLNLAGGFRRAGSISRHNPIQEFQDDFSQLIKELQEVCLNEIKPPKSSLKAAVKSLAKEDEK